MRPVFEILRGSPPRHVLFADCLAALALPVALRWV